MAVSRTVRKSDAGNSRAAAVLPAGGAWDGTARLTDGYARVDVVMTCEADAAGMFYVVHGPTVAAVTGCDPESPSGGCVVDAWSAAAAWAAHLAPVALRDKAFAVKWRGTAGKSLTLAATLDPRPIDKDIPIVAPTYTAAIANGATVLFPVPPGARTFRTSPRITANPLLAAVCMFYQAGAPGAALGDQWRYGQAERPLVPGTADLALFNSNGAQMDCWLAFYP